MKILPRHLLAILLIAGCGTKDPSPVGIDLVNLSGGEVVELLNVPSAITAPQLLDIFPSILGGTEEVLVGRMNGVEYTGVFRVEFAPTDFPGGDASTLAVDSLFVELRVLGGLVRGDLGNIIVSLPMESWSETRSFVDTTTFRAARFPRDILAEVTPTLADSTVRVPLPTSLLSDAIALGGRTPAVEFALSGAEGNDFLVVAGSRESSLTGKSPVLSAVYAGGAGSSVGTALDTYYADRLQEPQPGEVLLQTGILTGTTMKFELPSIPEASTVNVVELSFDFDFDRSFLTSLRLRIERLDVAGGDTTRTITSSNALNEQVVVPSGSPFLMNLDQLMFHGWMSGQQTNSGFSLTPIFEITPDLRYEWGLFSNPRLRIVYSLPPASGS
ncbi:MAG: hypothetical protein CME19_01795 [Gemmatimonadetes bacterium]|nr:hypothetical protein [Gemmatimonadota bacterium]